MKILMVCLGNICRSPMAQGLLEEKIKKFQLDWKVDSAGTSSYQQGKPPDPKAIACMKNHGIDIEHLRSRPLLPHDLERFDVIFCMDKSNYHHVLQLAKSKALQEKVKLILHQILDECEEEVPDPYCGGSDGFERVYHLLDKATDAIIQNYTAPPNHA
jgi:protein-tyrosine phosphatase